jgi:flagellar motility protein MotE (MotC chaperone)
MPGMDLDFSTLDSLRRNHPAWRLLIADYAPLIISFFDRVFVKSNVRGIEEAQLVSALEDELFALRQARGPESFPRSAQDYLDDWTKDERGWLRKYYPQDSDEAHFDLTPASEKAIAWIESLSSRTFVGTESRLRTVFELLRQLVEGTGVDPEERIRELKRQRKGIDAQIARIRGGEMETLDETAVRERFLHMASTSREILSDFREVEQNFRNLDRATRERIASWEGSKGELLNDILGARDVIADSDQGKSFRSFWDFLMSSERQEDFDSMLDAVFALPAVAALQPDPSLRRIHYDWMEAGERTQRTVALLSRQLRRFLDDQVWLENRRIMEIIHSVEAKALALRDHLPEGPVTELTQAAADIELPMERPLFSPPMKARVDGKKIELADENVDAEALFKQWVVDKAALRTRIRQALAERDQVTLSDLVAAFPMERGLTELIAYLSLAAEDRDALFSESEVDSLSWIDEQGRRRSAQLDRVIFAKEKSEHAESRAQ